MKLLNKFWPHLLILLTIFISYGQTLKMYFWQDDSALIFKLQNPVGPAGSFGEGIIGNGPYKYLVTPFVPFYPLFGIEPFGYFLVGFLTYILATGAFYLFARKMFDDKKVAYVSTLVFAAGYIGSDIMFRIINSWQTNVGLILTFLMFERLMDFLKTRKFGSYLFTVLLFLLNAEFVFIRSHSLIFPILFLDLIFMLKQFNIRRLLSFSIRQIPFIVIFKLKFLSDESFGAPGITSLLSDVFVRGEISKLAPVFVNTGNIFIPDIVTSRFINTLSVSLKIANTDSQIFAFSFLISVLFFVLLIFIWKKFKYTTFAKIFSFLTFLLAPVFNLILYSYNAFWYRDTLSIATGLLGMYVSTTIILFAITIWRKNWFLSVGMLFGLTMAVSQMVGYYIQYPTAIFGTTHRYFSYSLIGYAIFYASLYALFRVYKQKFLTLLVVLMIIIPNLILGFAYQKRIIDIRSIPSRNFYNNLMTYVPKVKKESVFYFDVSRKGVSPHQFADFFSVGSMPETTALAMYYGVDRYDVQMFTEFDELASKLASGEIEMNKTYTFYYSEDTGLINTTNEFRKRLSEKENFKVIDLQKGDFDISTPAILELSLIAQPKIPSEFGVDKDEMRKLEQKLIYLNGRQDYYRNVKATSVSEWKYREVRNVVDNNSDTVWQGHRIYWAENKNEKLTLDLLTLRQIGKIYWQNWKEMLTPTAYTFEYSIDGKNWYMLTDLRKKVSLKDGEWIGENFEPVEARYIRMNISGTKTDDSPAISEIEVVEAGHVVENVERTQTPTGIQIKADDISNWLKLFNLAKPLARLNVTWESEKIDPYSSKAQIPLNVDGSLYTYEIVLNSGGLNLKNISFESNLPVNIEVKNARIRNLTLEELKMRKLIKEFREN